MRLRRMTTYLILLATFCVLLSGCGKTDSRPDSGTENVSVVPEYKDIASLAGKKIAVSVGDFAEEIAAKYLPDAIRVPYSTGADCIMAVSTGKADAFITAALTYDEIIENYDNLIRQEEPTEPVKLCFALTKSELGEQLKSELDEFLKERWESGVQEEFLRGWENDSTVPHQTYDLKDLDGTRGTIRCAVEPIDAPFTYKTVDGFIGQEVELLHEFCRKYGYDMDITVNDWSGILPGISTGKFDVAFAVTYTDERAEKVLFSEPYVLTDNYVVCRKAGPAAGSDSGLFASIADSFERNFVRESRWKLLVRGLWVTIRVAVLSAVFGTLLGGVLCWLRSSRIGPVRTVTAAVIRFIQGVPVVVMLLVLYYVIFVRSSVSGLMVGVIGFSIDFSAYVAEILRSAIDSIDRGQWEAASALGFGPKKSFTKIIFPQAFTRAIPVYKGQFISMVKMTSVVGYIAVEDLAKAGDIIRSRTYDAFFPLIVTAVIYFLLAWSMTLLLGMVEVRVEPRHRKNPLADLNTDVEIGETKAERNPPENGGVMIEIRHLRKEYETVTPLEDVSVQIRRGDVISVIGPSGTGKSTLLRCINRLETPTSGEVLAFGQQVPDKGQGLYEIRKRMGMVFQSFNLFNHLTVIENIMLAPVTLKGVSRQQAYENGIRLLHRVGLAEKAMNYPSELSGGQKQRIAIVRTLAMEPEIILFDEPTSALDPTMIGEVLHVIGDLAKTGMTMLIVTHEMKFARDVSNRVFYMDCGGIYEDAPSEQIFQHPQKDRTRAFILRLKRFSFTAENAGFDFVKLRSDLETFGHEQLMSRRLIDSMILCVEEYTMSLPGMPQVEYPVRIAAEYHEESGALNLFLHYGGENVDLTEGLDEVSGKIVRSRSTGISHTFSPEEGNELCIQVKG